MSDNIFVSRDNNIYQIDMESSGSLRDTDLVLASREVNGVPTLFKVTGDKFGKAPAAPEITAVILQQNNENANRFTGNSFTSIVGSNEESPTAPTLMTAEVEGALSIEASTQPIASNAYSASTQTSVPLTLDGPFNLGDVFEVGDVVLANESYTPVSDTITSVASSVFSWSGDWVGATARTGGIWSGGGDINAMFNGTTDVYSPGNNGAYATITFDPPIPCSTLEIRANTSNQSVDGRLKLNNIDYGAATRAFPAGGGVTTAATVWTTIPNPPETISSLQIGWTGSWIATSGIRIDGTELRQNFPLEIPSPNKTLTFSTDKDIQLFQTGDIIKGLGNTARTYSDELQPNVLQGGSAVQLFDGNPGIGQPYNSYGLVTSSKQSFIFDPPIYFDGGSVNCVGYNTGGGGNFYIFIAGQEYEITLENRGTSVDNIRTGLPAGPITAFGCNSAGIGWTQVELNGQALKNGTAYAGAGGDNVTVVSTDVSAKTITVDSDVYFVANQSQEWSSNVVNDRIDYPAENAFNNTGFSNVAYAPNGATTTVNFTEIPVSTLRIAINKAGAGTNGIVLNGSVNVASQLTETDGWNTITGVTSLSSIEYRSTSGSDFVGIYQVEVDGKILINASVTPDWDTTISPTLAKRGEGTIQGISGSDVTISPFTDNCFKEDQFLVFKTPKVIEVTPLTDPIDSFNSATNTLTLTGDKDLSQLTNGDSVYMTDGTEPVNQDGYLLQTSNITDVVDSTVNSLDMIDRSKSGDERNDYPFSNFFDGNLGSFYYMGPNAIGLYLDIDIPAGSTVELYGNNGASDTQTITVRYNDGATTGSFLKSSTATWRDCSPEDQTIAITSMFIETVGNYGGWNALRINGQIVGTTYTSPTELTFEDPCTDLQYFKAQDVVQTSPEIKVLDINAANRTMKVTPGGNWNVSNQSQVWSSGVTSSTGSYYAGEPANQLFNGDTSTFANPSSGSGSSLTFTPPATLSYTESVEIYTHGSGSHSVNGGTSGTHNVRTWTTIASGSGTISNIVVTGDNYPAWAAIRVDGKLLVDPVNDSQVWSSNVTGNPAATQPVINGFDGNLATATWAQNAGYLITFPQPITVTESIELRGNSQQSNWKLLIDDLEIAINEFGQPAPSWSNNNFSAYDAEVTVNITGSFKGIRSTNNYGGLCAVYVDGTLLVDSGVRGNKRIEYQTNGGEGTVDTVDVGNNSIVIVPTGDRDNRWIGTNAAGSVFRAGSPTKPAISQKAYLKFTGAGVVESISAAPVAPQSMSSRNPTLIFPTEFDTNTTPDAELPNPTSLKTTISRTNDLGSATASSNKLLPTTTTRSDLTAGSAATFTTDGYAEFVCMALSHEGRAAEQRAITYAENCQALKDAAEQKAQDYINDNP